MVKALKKYMQPIVQQPPPSSMQKKDVKPPIVLQAFRISQGSKVNTTYFCSRVQNFFHIESENIKERKVEIGQIRLLYTQKSHLTTGQ